MSKGLVVSLVLPCYNEMEHIEISLKRILDFLAFVFPSESFEVILVDDMSKDGTRLWLQKLSHPRCRVFLNERNLGRGGAVKQGIKMARGTVVGFMDVDCEVSEAYIPKFVQAIIQGADVAIGSRIYRLAFHPYILFRHFASVGYRWLLHWFVKINVSDSETGFKFFSKRFADFIVEQSQFNDWFWDTEVALLSQQFGFQVLECPVAFQRNKLKTSTVHVIRDAIQFIKDVVKFKRLSREGVYHSPAKPNQRQSSFSA